jgi:Arc/MetJ-type ribon-helix-helix transcriptional regulator
MARVKISVTIDPTLLRVVDEFVANHEGADRSKVIDEALSHWSAAQQDAAMVAQYSEPDQPEEERAAWRRTRRTAAARRLTRV